MSWVTSKVKVGLISLSNHWDLGLCEHSNLSHGLFFLFYMAHVFFEQIYDSLVTFKCTSWHIFRGFGIRFMYLDRDNLIHEKWPHICKMCHIILILGKSIPFHEPLKIPLYGNNSPIVCHCDENKVRFNLLSWYGSYKTCGNISHVMFLTSLSLVSSVRGPGHWEHWFCHNGRHHWNDRYYFHGFMYLCWCCFEIHDLHTYW